jgi:hypothetical protein
VVPALQQQKSGGVLSDIQHGNKCGFGRRRERIVTRAQDDSVTVEWVFYERVCRMTGVQTTIQQWQQCNRGRVVLHYTVAVVTSKVSFQSGQCVWELS